MREFTVGADPEMFLCIEGTTDFVSAHNMFPGTKLDPYPVLGGAIQVDGMAAEVNINPAKDRVEFLRNIQTVMKGLEEHLPPGVSISHGTPVAHFEPFVMDMQPPEAKELGCDPDYNGWTGKANPRPNGEVLFRTASGHIHMGWGANVKDPYKDQDHYELCCAMARQMDYYVGIYSLLWDPDNQRRMLYGKAGAFRAKPYGIEYRTPSTAWLADPELQAWVFDATVKAMEDFFEGNVATDVYGNLAQSIIDNNVTDWQDKFDIVTGLTFNKKAA